MLFAFIAAGALSAACLFFTIALKGLAHMLSMHTSHTLPKRDTPSTYSSTADTITTTSKSGQTSGVGKDSTAARPVTLDAPSGHARSFLFTVLAHLGLYYIAWCALVLSPQLLGCLASGLLGSGATIQPFSSAHSFQSLVLAMDLPSVPLGHTLSVCLGVCVAAWISKYISGLNKEAPPTSVDFLSFLLRCAVYGIYFSGCTLWFSQGIAAAPVAFHDILGGRTFSGRQWNECVWMALSHTIALRHGHLLFDALLQTPAAASSHRTRATLQGVYYCGACLAWIVLQSLGTGDLIPFADIAIGSIMVSTCATMLLGGAGRVRPVVFATRNRTMVACAVLLLASAASLADAKLKTGALLVAFGVWGIAKLSLVLASRIVSVVAGSLWSAVLLGTALPNRRGRLVAKRMFSEKQTWRAQTFPPGFPNSWYKLFNSWEVPRNSRKPRLVTCLGRTFAVFRTKEGSPIVIEAGCPHGSQTHVDSIPSSSNGPAFVDEVSLSAFERAAARSQDHPSSLSFSGPARGKMGRCDGKGLELKSGVVHCSTHGWMCLGSASTPTVFNAPQQVINVRWVHSIESGPRAFSESPAQDAVPHIPSGSIILDVANPCVVEYATMICVYFDAEGRPAPYLPIPLPEIDSGRYKYRGRAEQLTPMHIQDFVENAADTAHFNHVHSKLSLPVASNLTYIKHQTQWEADTELPHVSHFFDTADLYGVFSPNPAPRPVSTRVTFVGCGGLVYFRFVTPHGDIVLLKTFLPVHPLRQRVQDVWYADPNIPRLLVYYIVREALNAFSDDIHLWENKVYSFTPVLVRDDGPISKVRRWYQQFYSASSRFVSDQVPVH